MGVSRRHGRFRLIRAAFTLVLVPVVGTSALLSSPWPAIWVLPSMAAGLAMELAARPRGAPGMIRLEALGAPALTLAIVVPATLVHMPPGGAFPLLLALLLLEGILTACPLTERTLRCLCATAVVHVVLLGTVAPPAAFLSIALVATAPLLEFTVQLQILGFPRSLQRTSGFSHRAYRAARGRLEDSVEPLSAGRRVLGPLWLGTVACAAFLFVLAPRGARTDPPGVPAGPGAGGERVAGGPAPPLRGRGGTGPRLGIGTRHDVFLATIGRLEDDRSLALRIRCTDPDGAPYECGSGLRIRGFTLDTYRDGRWLAAAPSETVRDADDGTPDGWTTVRGGGAAPPRGATVLQEIVLEPLGSPALFGLPEPARAEVPALAVDGRGGGAFPEAPRRPVRYRIVSRVLDPSSPALARIPRVPKRGRDTRLPRPYPRVERLARAVAGNEGSLLGTCRAIERHLRSRYRYTRSFEPSSDLDPVEDFLFRRRSGYCVHFASAMIVMLRSLGVPARLACGFVTDEGGRAPGEYLARRGDAHTWVEVRFEGVGWVGFDPSPPQRQDAAPPPQSPPGWLGWLERLAGFGGEERRALLASIARLARTWGVAALAALLAAAFGTGFLRSRRGAAPPGGGGRRPGGRERTGVPFYDAYLRALARRGIRRRESATARELAGAARGVLPEGAVEVLTEAFGAVRYGARPLDAEGRARVEEALRAVREAASHQA